MELRCGTGSVLWRWYSPVLRVRFFLGNSIPPCPASTPQSLEVVLYYQASQRKLDELAKEEREMEECKRNEKQAKKESVEVATKPAGPSEESTEQEEGDYKEGEEKEDNEDDDEESSETAEKGKVLALSESKKVIRAEARGHVEMRPGLGCQLLGTGPTGVHS